jgi:hypothetical protein
MLVSPAPGGNLIAGPGVQTNAESGEDPGIPQLIISSINFAVPLGLLDCFTAEPSCEECMKRCRNIKADTQYTRALTFWRRESTSVFVSAPAAAVAAELAAKENILDVFVPFFSIACLLLIPSPLESLLPFSFLAHVHMRCFNMLAKK